MTRAGCIGVALTLGLLGVLPSRAQLNIWTGPANGVWSDPLNWSIYGPVPPFTPTTFLWIDGDNIPGQDTVAVVDQSYSIYEVQVYGGDTMVVASGVNLTLEHGLLGSTTSGYFALDPGGQLTIGGSNVAGALTIDGQMDANSRLHNLGPIGLHLNADIIGQGTISGDVSIQSFKTLNANVAGAVLRIDAPPLDFDNQGTLAASGNGILELFGKFTNTFAGNFNAGGGTIALLNGATITGGTFAASGAGRVFIGRGGPAMVVCENVTNNGTLQITNSSILEIGTAMLNNGTIIMSNVGGATPTLSGSTYRLTNASTAVIRGRGRIGVDLLEITNNGTIEASGGGAILEIDPPNVVDAFLNNGTLLATIGGILRLSGENGGTFSNGPSSFMMPSAGATIELQNGAFIHGGTFYPGSGIVRLQSSVGTATLKDVTNDGTISLAATTRLNLEGTLVNNGWINVGTSSAGVASLGASMAGVATLSGSGTVTLMNEDDARILGNHRLVSSVLIQGEGKIGGGTMQMTNSGTIDANVLGKTIEIHPPFTINAFVNDGHVRARNGGMLELAGAAFIGGGTYDIQTASQLDANATLLLTGGYLANAGTVNLLGGGTASFGTVDNSGWLNVAAGTLSVGTITQTGAMVNDGTVIILTSGNMPGGISGGGTLVVDSATLTARHIRQTALDISSMFVGSSTVEIQSSGSGTIGTSKVQSLEIDFGDRLELNDNALLVEDAAAFYSIRDMIYDGRIMSLTPGMTPAEDAVGIAEHTGSFRGQTIGSVAACVAAALRGDGDLSGTVDSVDFGFFISGFGSTGYFTRWQYGDYNADFHVNTEDFNYLAGNFGLSMPAAALGALVPEPHGAAALVLLIVASGRRASRLT